MSHYHSDYLSSINEVKQWLSYKHLDEYIYLLLDHGFDDLDSISQCNEEEMNSLVQIFTTDEKKKSMQTLVEALRQLGIDVYRKQKSEFRRLIDLDEKNKKQEVIAEQVSRVRGQSQAVGKPVLAPTPTAAATTASDANSSPSSSPSPPSSIKLPPPVASLAAAVTSSTVPPSPSSSSSSRESTGSHSASPAVANPTQNFDVTSWEGAIHFQAYLHSIQCYARAFDEPILASAALETKLLEGRSDAHLIKIKKQLAALVEGAVFKKFKRGNSAKRLIWCSAAFDFVIWGEEDKSLVKGYIATHDIQEINQGFGLKTKNRLYIVSPERTLELEARDANQAKEWKEMLEMLIQLNMSELEQKKLLQSSTNSSNAFQAKFAKAKAEYTKLISTGSVFKKWPGKSTLGSFTTRLVWSPSVVDRLQWGDIMTKKVMGFVLMQDVVEITPDAKDRSKFTIFAMKRSLELEARNEQVRERWIKALRFFVEFKQQATGQ